MMRLARIMLAGSVLVGFAFSPVGMKLKLIKSAEAIDNPLVCSKTSLPDPLKISCPSVIKIVEEAKTQPEIQKKSVEPLKQPIHQGTSASYTYTPPLTPSAPLNTDIILDLINAHRQQIGLPHLEKDQKLCDIAQSRIPELPGEAASGNYHAGLYAKHLPFWITENMKIGGNEEVTVNWWLNSPIHRAAIEGDYKYSCGAAVGDISVQEFTNWVPK